MIGEGDLCGMMNTEIVETSPEKTSPEKMGGMVSVEAEISGGINEFDMQIWQLQSEVKRKKREREQRAKLLLYGLKEQMKEFENRWFEEVSEAASMELVELVHGMGVYGGEHEDGKFHLSTYRSTITLKYFMEKHTFDIEPNDEFEDIDIHDFHLRCYRLDKDDLFKVNHVFGEMESLVPYMVRWNRERESLRSDLQVQIIRINMELLDLDGELKSLREQIHEVRILSFLAGNTISFDDRRPRRIRYKVGEFHFADQLRLVSLSASGKTCTFEAVTYEKLFGSTSYYSGDRRKGTTVIEGVRVRTVVGNFYENR